MYQELGRRPILHGEDGDYKV